MLIDFNKTLSMIIKQFKAQNCIVGDKPHIGHIKLQVQSMASFLS